MDNENLQKCAFDQSINITGTAISLHTDISTLPHLGDCTSDIGDFPPGWYWQLDHIDFCSYAVKCTWRLFPKSWKGYITPDSIYHMPQAPTPHRKSISKTSPTTSPIHNLQMNNAIIKIVFYLPGNYTPHSLEYTIPPATFARLKDEHARYWSCPGAMWVPVSQAPTFKRLFAPVLHKLHARSVTAYIKKTS